MLRDALTFPIRGADTEGVFLPGLVLSFAVALAAELPLAASLLGAVPAVVLVGYLGTVYAAAIDGADTPPPFGSPTAVTRRGALLFGLGAVYLLPAVLALAVTALGAQSLAVTPDSLTNAETVRLLAGSTALLVVVVGSVYAVPAAAGCALTAGSVRAGLSPVAVGEHATDGAYFVAFWVAVALVGTALWGGWVLAGLLGRPGAALGVVVTFHALVAGAYLVGRGFGTSGPLYDLL